VRLLLDEHFSGEVAARLRDLGHEVVALTADREQRGLDDADVFAMAQSQGRAVVTYDREDFEALVRTYIKAKRPHHGLILVDPRRLPGREFARLVAALSALLEGPDLGTSFVIWLQSLDHP
jgi:predicted nuclease of predicted toxin-antitoxin system